MNWLEHYADSYAIAGIIRVAQVIAAVDEIYIDVVRVVPRNWPWLDESEPKAAVLEARVSINQPRASDAELVFTPKIGPETLVWNASFAARTQSQCRLRMLSLLLGRSSLSMLLPRGLAALFLLYLLGLLLLLLLLLRILRLLLLFLFCGVGLFLFLLLLLYLRLLLLSKPAITLAL